MEETKETFKVIDESCRRCIITLEHMAELIIIGCIEKKKLKVIVIKI